MGTGTLETLQHGSTSLCPAGPCLCAGTCGSSPLAVLLPTPYHLCVVAVMLRKWRVRSEGCNHPPALLCLTWDKSWALSLIDIDSSQGKPGLLDLGFQAEFKAEQAWRLLTNVAKNYSLRSFHPQEKYSAQDPHLSVLLATQCRHWCMPAVFSWAACAMNHACSGCPSLSPEPQ